MGFEVGNDYGLIGLLYVIPEARGQGLGSYITCQLAEQYHQDALPVVATAKQTNEASLKLHERVGFHKMCVLNYVYHMWNKVHMPGQEQIVNK